MISHLRGKLAGKEPNLAVVDVNGVGYAVAIAVTTYSSLPALGGDVVLHTYTHVREDTLALFGFLTSGDRKLFEKLITVSGVGPRLALTVLSGMKSQELLETIQSGDAQRLTKIPGVGRKTGERIILELREKLGGIEGQRAPSTPGAAVENEVVSALVNLGCSRDAADKAVDKARMAGAPPEFDALFRKALDLVRS
ncbi:MAG: Holliday junction branch migration protein RuvA [Acidobacteria bacterium]|nr:Holliday junction branch migration protein RuvA [Acidobacteriota bacterium]